MTNSNTIQWQRAYGDMIYWKWQGMTRLSDAHIRSAVGFMERALALKPGSKILELGCGLGYHAIELARRGYEVTGLEWSREYLEQARQKATDSNVNVNFVQGNMAELTFEKVFNAIVLWDNTFATFSDEENVQTLHGIKRALQKGGLALIDTQNYIALPEKIGQGWNFDEDDPNLLFLTEGTRDIELGRFGFTVLALNVVSGERHTMPFSWRLYLVPELEHLLNDAGLNLIGIYGDDPKIANWNGYTLGDPYPYSMEGFTDKAAKRILLCQA